MSWPKVATLSQLVARALRRPKAHKPPPLKKDPPGYYRAEGGPWAGSLLLLSDGNTAALVVNVKMHETGTGREFYHTVRGRYRCGLVAGRGPSSPGTTKWIPA